MSIAIWSADRIKRTMIMTALDDTAVLPQGVTDSLDAMEDNVQAATSFLKALAHEGRLMILCHLASGEKSVTELERLLSARQSAVSQQLARLRMEGLVSNRRDGKIIYYRIADEKAARILEVLHEFFCETEAR
jgi:ArsR family transcriptional regulator